ncbi:MAG: diaminopimelate decarboxylase [Bacteroidales bacterium]|nr:diaminopimelate decarboxylase [Bacteroidales bacterium]MDD4770872.1 diaminopimelate decarboxylase [Bacteroidales bacterium]
MTVKGTFPTDVFQSIETPFYYYDTNVLRATLDLLKKEADRYRFKVHYALKANAEQRILSIIHGYGLGADCVSGGEIKAAIQAGFPASKIVFAGVGKADWEINLALDYSIFCFNVESIPELLVINELAAAKGKVAHVAIRVNPNVKADTHHYITTGTAENKFGIALSDLDKVIDVAQSASNIKLIGLHFHIGSQIMEMNNFAGLCSRLNELQDQLEARGVFLEHINVGGGLGIDYHNPDRQSIPDFANYFATFKRMLKLREGQTLHFEPGRSIVGQCGSLISKVLYVKEGVNRQFAIVDGGMTELIRPALYQAYHQIENISSEESIQKYDVVGPICESSDTFGKEVELNQTKRGDFIAIRSAGAYGQIMASQYNLRRLPNAVFSEDLI